jgi:predicted metalloprotease
MNMRREGRRSSNIEDRRGQQMAGIGGGGLILMRMLPFLLRSKGGRFLLLIVGGLFLLSYFGLDGGLLGNLTGVTTNNPNRSAALSAEQQELADFVSVVLADTEDTWNAIFAEQGADYPEPTLVLFTGAVQSACGVGQAAMGPFYCPGDQQVYIDLSFYEELRTRFSAAGDFAQAYVIAHEVGHHVQYLLGIADEVNARQRGLSSNAQVNELSVLQELQADCFAGLWANHAQRARQVLEQGDIQEALTAAQAIGDDTLQRQSQGYVRPESFTHGTSEQRMRWFNTGWEQGTLQSCDTFSAQ